VVRLARVDDLDARAAEGMEQLVELVRGGDFQRQQLVDLVVQQVAFFHADGDQLPYLVVFFVDGQVRVLRWPRGHTRGRRRRTGSCSGATLSRGDLTSSKRYSNLSPVGTIETIGLITVLFRPRSRSWHQTPV